MTDILRGGNGIIGEEIHEKVLYEYDDKSTHWLKGDEVKRSWAGTVWLKSQMHPPSERRMWSRDHDQALSNWNHKCTHPLTGEWGQEIMIRHCLTEITNAPTVWEENEVKRSWSGTVWLKSQMHPPSEQRMRLRDHDQALSDWNHKCTHHLNREWG